MPLVCDTPVLSVNLRHYAPRKNANTILRAYMPELDVLRGVAILLVLFYHGFGLSYATTRLTGWPRFFIASTSYGWVGVDLFFVLSGFLITGILLESRSFPAYYRRFYIRRGLRILPIYCAILLVLGVVTRTPLFLHAVPWSFLGISAVFLANFSPAFGIPVSYGVLWSLAVEEHFYLVWPALVRKFSDRGTMLLAGAICIVCPCLRAASFHLHRAQGWTDYGAYTWLVADGLATGAMLAGALRSTVQSRPSNWKLSIAALATGVGLLICGAPFGILSHQSLLGVTLRQTALNIFFLGILLLALLLGTGPWHRYAAFKPLRFLGEISYGVYLIHTLIFWIVGRCLNIFLPHAHPAVDSFPMMCELFLIALTATIFIGYISRWYFEERFLRLKERFAS